MERTIIVTRRGRSSRRRGVAEKSWEISGIGWLSTMSAISRDHGDSPWLFPPCSFVSFVVQVAALEVFSATPRLRVSAVRFSLSISATPRDFSDFSNSRLTLPYPAVQDSAATLSEKDSHEKPLDQARLNYSNGLNFIWLL